MHVRTGDIAGLYAITPDVADTAVLVSLVEAALAGGASVIQYRNKVATPELRFEQATRLAVLCASFDVPLIINDHVGLAMSIEDAGLHVGAEDCDGATSLRALRSRLGTGRILGVSCYRSIELAREVVVAGADYVAFGSVFASTTKPRAMPASLALFDEARGLDVVTVGIGGITRGQHRVADRGGRRCGRGHQRNYSAAGSLRSSSSRRAP